MTPYSLTPLVSALERTMLAALPEIEKAAGGGGLREAEFASRVRWNDIPTPSGVIVISSSAEAEWVTNGYAWEGPVDLWYVITTRGENTGIRERMETLINAFLPFPRYADAGQVTGIMGFGWDDDLRPNQMFVQSGRSARAGFVRLRCLTGVTRT